MGVVAERHTVAGEAMTLKNLPIHCLLVICHLTPLKTLWQKFSRDAKTSELQKIAKQGNPGG